ncbi:MAG: ECF transporter S component [Muribaculaceae bacterium]|nr:ECF transporter S component [Muribaculaceae bacterium]
MLTTINPKQLTFADARTYLGALLFIAGNIALPQLCHLFALGGPTWLPIYFFTLIGSLLCGWRVGLLTALASPLINCAAFGMPAAALLPAIVLKSVLLASAAGFAATRLDKINLLTIVAIVAFYQLFGSLGEWAICGDLHTALLDLRIGLPGMLVQILGGYITVKLINNHKI